MVVELIGYIVITLFAVYGLSLFFMLVAWGNELGNNGLEHFAVGAFIALFCIAIYIRCFLANPEDHGYQKIIESEEVREQ